MASYEVLKRIAEAASRNSKELYLTGWNLTEIPRLFWQ